MFPVVHDSVLYFSSEGLTGYGGLDLFSSVYSHGAWSKPQNLKTPFSSSADDFSVAFNSDNKSGYFSSNRKDGVGGDDIYSFFLTPVNLVVKGRVTDADNTSLLAGATIVLSATDGTTDTTTTNANGEYSFNLGQDKDYKINVLNPGYFGDSKKLSTQAEKFSKEFGEFRFAFNSQRFP